MSEEDPSVADESATSIVSEKSAEVEKPAEQAQTDTPEEAAEPKADSDEAKPKPKSRAQERIEQLARTKRNLQRALARANQQIGQIKSTPPPTEEEFGDAAAYTRAQIKRATQESAAEGQIENLSTEYEGLRARRQEVWAERVAEARERIPDFDNAFDPTVPVTEVMADLISESDHGIELAYYLGKNRSVAHRIAEMGPIEAARELGRLEAKVSVPAAKKVSSAPPPVKTITGKAHAGGKTFEDMSYDEYKAARMAQIKAKQGR